MLIPALQRLASCARYAVLMAFGALVAVTLVDGFSSRRLPELAPWHRVELSGEYQRHRDDVADFAAYVALERRLLDELWRRVIEPYEPAFAHELSRYVPGSPSDPARFGRDYNRSYELRPGQVRGAVVLLHGLTDSPYSLHHLGAQFHALGFHVVALRLPGRFHARQKW